MDSADVLLVLHRALEARASPADGYCDASAYGDAHAWAHSHYDCDASAYGDPYPDCDASAYGDPYPDCDASAYGDPYPDCDASAYGDPYPDCDASAYGDAHAWAHSHYDYDASAYGHSDGYCGSDGYCDSPSSAAPSSSAPSSASSASTEDLHVGVDRPDPDVAAAAGAVGVDCSLRQWFHGTSPSRGTGRAAVSDRGLKGGPRGAPLDSPATGVNARCARRPGGRMPLDGHSRRGVATRAASLRAC
ncbi:hypothetical protein [Candidatus Poriferisocius sp.]|uniref:hypothetical protein n=1 Tax=Candidatus Poriferisocius sp. TaxID=3101276 RepID=UPI003B52E256